MTTTIYKVQVNDADHYIETEAAARLVYALAAREGNDCRLWKQEWDDEDEPYEECLASTEDAV